MVLGGTGYVAGELLRLIAGAPAASRSPAVHVGQPARRAGRPAPSRTWRGAYADTRFSSQAQVQKILCASAAGGGVLRRAPRRLGRAHRCAAERRGAGRDAAARGRYLGGLPLPHRRRPTRPCTARRTGRRRACAQFTLRACRSTCTKLATPHVAPSGLFRHARSCSRACRCSPLASSSRRCSSAASPAAPARDASPSRARIIRCATATSTATARWRTATCPKSTACAQAATGVEAQFAFVPHSGPFARGIHVTAAGARSGARSTPRSCWRSLRAYYAARAVRARHRRGRRA